MILANDNGSLNVTSNKERRLQREKMEKIKNSRVVQSPSLK